MPELNSSNTRYSEIRYLLNIQWIIRSRRNPGNNLPKAEIAEFRMRFTCESKALESIDIFNLKLGNQQTRDFLEISFGVNKYYSYIAR